MIEFLMNLNALMFQKEQSLVFSPLRNYE